MEMEMRTLPGWVDQLAIVFVALAVVTAVVGITPSDGHAVKRLLPLGCGALRTVLG